MNNYNLYSTLVQSDFDAVPDENSGRDTSVVGTLYNWEKGHVNMNKKL